MCFSSTLFPAPESPMIAVIRSRGMSRVIAVEHLLPLERLLHADEPQDRLPGPDPFRPDPDVSVRALHGYMRTDVMK